MTTRRMGSTLALGLALLLGAGLAAAPAGADSPAMGPQHKHGGNRGTMSAERQAAHEKMMQEMMAHDEKIESLAAQMNAAKGQAKVDAMAALLNEMVAQRRTMRAHMEKRQSMRGDRKGTGGGPPKPPEMN